jgi:hypothetical protein
MDDNKTLKELVLIGRNLPDSEANLRSVLVLLLHELFPERISDVIKELDGKE